MAQICFLCSPMHHVCVSVYRVQSDMCSPMHRIYLEEGAQICFLCSLMHHVFVSAWRVSPYFVLSNAPRLLDWPKSVSCALQCTTSECLSTGSNLVCAHYCTTSVWRGPKSVSSVFAWRVPTFLLCSLMHLVCQCLLGGFQVF